MKVEVAVDLFQKVAETYKLIVEDRSKINALLVLVNIFESEQEYELLQVSSEAIFKVLKLMIEETAFRPGRPVAVIEGDSSSQLSVWLNAVYEKYLQRCLALLGDRALEEIGFNSVIQIFRLLSFGSDAEFAFPTGLLTTLMEAIIAKDASETGLYDLFDESVNSYRDIRYYSLRVIARLAKKVRETEASADTSATYKRLFKILSEIVMETDAEIESGEAEVNPMLIETTLPAAVSATKAHLQEFSACWLEFIQGISTHAPELHRSILLIINERVIPYMTKPTLLSDYLTDSYNAGGLVSLLALNGLFTLMHKHNLDYPSFFPKLYSLLDDKILHCRYRKRFCRLLGIFMTSTHMPAYMVAAFVKRISRLSLNASPAVITWVIPFIYNLFKAHPAVRVLIHRQTEGLKNDPFNMNELDPSKCKAIESSIWEIHALSRHYWTGAVKQSRIFTERLTKPLFKLDDHLDGPTYNSLIQEELTHRWTKVPPLNISISENLF